MKEFWNSIQLVFAEIWEWFDYFLGGYDGLFYTLVAFMVVEYVARVMCVIADKSLSSEIEFKAICKKVLILMLVGVANLLDVEVIRTGAVLRLVVILFYLSNEGLSFLKSSAHLGLPIPKKLREILAQLHDRAESEDDENEEG